MIPKMINYGLAEVAPTYQNRNCFDMLGNLLCFQSYARGLSRGKKPNTMGAHHIRIVGVGSSNLLGSTKKEATDFL